jgi:hypothetical protein
LIFYTLKYLRLSPKIAAARIGLDGMNRGKNYCEWVASCHGGDAYKVFERSSRNRHYHKGFMTEYKLAKKLVDLALEI